jgi:ribosomal protein S18 acetylase RimI-like enzyme
VVFDKALRRLGYGRRVFRMVAETLAVGAGLKQLTVRIRKDNRAALSFWKGMGFEDAGCEDGICSMEIDLTSAPHD